MTDYAAKAREIADKLEQASFDYELALTNDGPTEQQLRRRVLHEARNEFVDFVLSAHASGYEEGKEEAAKVAEPPVYDGSPAAALRDSIAQGIRSLPAGVDK